MYILYAMSAWKSVLSEILRGCPEELEESLRQFNADAVRGRAFVASGGLFSVCGTALEGCRAVVLGGHCMADGVGAALRALAGENCGRLGIVHLFESLSASPDGPHDWDCVVNMLLYHVARRNPGCRVVLVGRRNWTRAAYVNPRLHRITKIDGDVHSTLEDLVQELHENISADSIQRAPCAT